MGREAGVRRSSESIGLTVTRQGGRTGPDQTVSAAAEFDGGAQPRVGSFNDPSACGEL